MKPRCLAAGDGAALIKEIQPAGEIVRQMMSEAEQVISGRLSSVIKASAKLST